MTLRRISGWLSILMIASLGVGSAEEYTKPLDPRLSGFLETIFKDKADLERERQEYASRGVTLEAFILAVYTRAVEFDDTPDNAKALAQLGQYLEERRPPLAPVLLDRMTEFYADKSHQSFMRGMFLETIRGLPHGDATSMPTGPASLRFSGLENKALGYALLTAKKGALSISGIGGSGADGVRIQLPPGATGLRVRALVPDEAAVPDGAYLEITSRLSEASDSLGFLRIMREGTGGDYVVSGEVTNVESPVLILLRQGHEVRRDVIKPHAFAFARVRASLKYESSLNDALSESGAILRWQWSKPGSVTVVNRAAGPDTTVTCDELRLTDPDGKTDGETISELVVRGRGVGEIRILGEEVVKAKRSR